MKKEIIKTVHDKHLETLLDRLGLLEKIQQRLLKCALCNKVITFDNLQGIYKEKEDIRIVCDNLGCYKKLIDKQL